MPMPMPIVMLALPLAAACAVSPPRIAPDLRCVGEVSTPVGSVVVVGTVHTPCQSAAEVRRVIAACKPDAVVVELDQERLDLLLDGSPGRDSYGD